MKINYFKFILIILVVAFVVPQVTFAAWWNPFSWGWVNRVFHFQQTQQKQEKQVACPMDAKLCPDGSSVGRQGPKCEFKACPPIKYFEIKEFNVKFKLPNAIKDLIYSSSTDDTNTSRYIAFTTDSLVNKDKDCGPSSIGTMEMTSAAPDKTTPRNLENLVLKTDSLYFYYYRPQAVCANSQDNKEAIQLQGDQTKALEGALKGLQLLQTKDQACVASGGKIIKATCYCAAPKDFFNTCVVGACTCTPNPKYKRDLKTCDCGQGKCWDGNKCTSLNLK